jgi:hypothetical protein
MKRSPRSPRTAANLSEPIQQRLNMYALSATAAGVGMLALAQPAEGKIVYTPAHKNVGYGYNLDLNHDGTADFRFCRSNNTQPCSFSGSHRRPGYTWGLYVGPLNGSNLIWGKQVYSSRVGTASALPAGVQVGSTGLFAKRHYLMARCEESGGPHYCQAPWKHVTGRYLGLKFVINGEIHYGWARLNVNWTKDGGGDGKDSTLTGYAYETIPNKAIITGKTKGPDVITVQPSTLGHLAKGASAVSGGRGR